MIGLSSFKGKCGLLLLGLMIWVNLFAYSQFLEDFSDGDFTNDPIWLSSNESGNGSDFVVLSEELVSAGPAAAATLWLSTEALSSALGNEVIWEFNVRYNFPPSAGNNIRVFLSSDKQNLADNPKGYYIQLGENGSLDGIQLFNTSSSSPVIPDSNPTIATGINASIRVTFDGEEKWTLEADATGGSNYTMIGSGIDSELTIGPYFGFRVKHSGTRNSDFFFDNVSIALTDKLPPKLVATEAVSSTELMLTFSEALSPLGISEVSNYSIDQGIGNPISAKIGPRANEVILKFSSLFENANDYKVTINNLQDPVGNILSSNSFDFIYFIRESIAFKDIVINEMMADFEPPNDLPESEFVEIFNRSDKVFNLGGWSFSDVSKTTALPSVFIKPGEFIILCPEVNVDQFMPFGKTLGLSPWPTINDSGDALIIRDEMGFTIDSINYDDGWYRSTTKAQGGWTLELIDPQNICSEEDNWEASEDFAGGTPARLNSVNAQNPDLMGPKITEAFAIRPDSIIITFGEKIDLETISTATITISNDLGILSRHVSPGLRTLSLVPDRSVISGTAYTLKISNLKDCSGNLIRDADNSVTFHLLEKADPGDIVINEILFNPRIGGVDFLEIYNASDKHLNLEKSFVANSEPDVNGKLRLINAKTIVKTTKSIAPKEYMVFTTDATVLFSQYSRGISTNFFEVSSLPPFSDKEGSAAIARSDSVIIDYIEYDENYHFELIDKVDGISLERVSFDESSLNSDNWKSAIEPVGFATPGYINSRSIEQPKTAKGTIAVDPEIIVPDGSGQNDFSTIAYSFQNSGMVASVKILDMQGRVVRILAENDFIGTSGFYTWAGIDDRGQKARTGYYIIYFQVFDSAGSVLEFKKKVVVGSRF